MAAEDEEGHIVEAVVKFSESGSAQDAMATLLARDLGLTVAEPCLVSVDAALVADAQGDRTALGSIKLPPGFSTWPIGKHADPRIAAELFAFDVLLNDSDRKPESPNLLTDGKLLVLLDCAIDATASDPVRDIEKHVFGAQLRGKPLDLSRFEHAWHALTDARIDAYVAALPAAWLGAAECARFIKQLRDRLDTHLDHVRRLLA